MSLLWDARTDQVSIALTDERSGESLSFEIDPSQALSAFHHPYAYAPHADDELLRPPFGDGHPTRRRGTE